MVGINHGELTDAFLSSSDFLSWVGFEGWMGGRTQGEAKNPCERARGVARKQEKEERFRMEALGPTWL